ncbi:MAG: TonB-dependent receptor [Gemmatimonadetes bacterium]|nr:TonB-dependent receptor [Gemmatimonadota bacterium]
MDDLKCTQRPVNLRRLTRMAGSALSVVLLAASPIRAQTTGRILGRILDAATRQPVEAAEVIVPRLELLTLTTERGLFVLAALPPGEHELRVTRIGYQAATLEKVEVQAGRTTQITVELSPVAVEVEALVAQVERLRLIEPDVTASHEVVLGRELRALPVDAVEEAIELAPGVTDGHFRGGRVGQEVYLVDGLEVKNQLEASTQGPGIEFSPSSLQEVEVVTGGFGAGFGSALSGVVRYVTRRGNPERWEWRASALTDQWAPDGLFLGFTSFSASAGGPVGFLGRGTTLFADVWLQGMEDAEPRARGLTCLKPEDGDAQLASRIESLASDPTTRHLTCPFTTSILPHQRGDKLIAFLRIDRPLPGNATLTVSALRNRRQRELYTPEFKYNPRFQLGQRSTGTIATLTLDWASHHRGGAYHVTWRAARLRLDRYLGAIDPWTFEERARIGPFGFADFRFLGEGFTRLPVEFQMGSEVPGYVAPGGATGSPFGPAAEGIFFTEGTPTLANWSRSEFLGTDLVGELLSARGHTVQAGISARFYRVESYEQASAHLAGAPPNHARFHPRTLTGYAEASLAAAEDFTIQLGVRVDAFRSGLSLRRDTAGGAVAVVEPGWKASVNPRIGVAAPVPGTDGRTAFRFNYGLLVQPPDFRYFLDTTIGDSLRTDIQRQGNPDLAFERGTAYEAGFSHLLNDDVALGFTFFLKELNNLVTGSLGAAGSAPGQFTTGDFGSVRGLEVTLRGHWPGLRVRAGYTLQKAKGITSSALDDPGGEITERRLEFPLAFDRRHSADLVAVAGRAAGADASGWGGSLTASVRSGRPLDRQIAAGEFTGARTIPTYLPWIALVDVRVSRELGALPGCGRCAWRVVADGRNVLARDNVIALRRDTGRLAPDASTLLAFVGQVPDDMEPIPRESPRYSARVDLDRDGLITVSEFRTARFAAALDRHDPSLFFGEPTQVRLGLEVSF